MGVSGSGYQPGSLVTVYAQPGKVNLGTLTVGPDGKVQGSVYIPPTLPSSGVTLQIDGIPFGGGPASGPISVGVGVETGPPASGSGSTGSSTGKGAAGVPSAPAAAPGGGLTTVKPGAGQVVPSGAESKPAVTAGGVKAPLPGGGTLEATVTGPTGVKGGASGGGTSGTTGGGASGAESTVPKVQPGGFVEVKGGGLEPGTSANVWFIPKGSTKPVFSGTVQVGANGEVKGWAAIPPGLPKGDATMQIDVVTKGEGGKPGKGATVSVGVTVDGPPPVVEGKPAAPITPAPAPWPGGGTTGPTLPTGETDAVCSGCAANPPVTTSPTGAPKVKTFEVGGTTVGLGSTGEGGATNPQSPTTPVTLTPGGFANVSGSGFQPGSTVSVYANPGKILLGTVTAGPDGSVSGPLPIPSTLPSNATIQLDGVTKPGAEQSVATGTTTTPPAAPAGPLSGLGQGPAAQPPAPLANPSGEVPQVKPGKSSMIPATPAVSPPTVSGGTITTGLPTGGSVGITPVDDKGAPTGGSTAKGVQPTAGGLVGVKGSGFAPGTTVQVWLVPGPIFGGSVTVGSDGSLDGWVKVPVGTKPGDYTMQLSGTGQTTSGTKAPVGWSQGITVAAGSSGGSTGTTVNTDPKPGPVLAPAAQPVGQPGGGLPQQSPGTSSGAISPPIDGGAQGGGAAGGTSSSGTGKTSPVTTTTQTSPSGTSVTITAPKAGGSGTGGGSGAVTAEVAGTTPTGGTQPVGAGGVVNAPQGGFINTNAGGFAPGTPVNVFLLPSLTPIGTGTAGPKGTVAVTSPVPTGTSTGSKTLQIVGLTPGGQPLALNLGVNIATGDGAGSVPASSPLAETPGIVRSPGGKPVGAAAGKQAVLFNGSAAPFTLSKETGSTTVTTSVSSVSIGAPRDATGAVVLKQGTEISISGSGALPGSVVSIWSTNGERLLGRVMVGPDGTYSGWISIPTTLPGTVGSLQINATLSDGKQQTVALGANFEPQLRSGGGEVTKDRAVTYFNFGSGTLTKGGRAALREFAALFPTNSYSVTNVVGAVRATGATAADRALAQKRVRNVKRFLVKQGVEGIINISTQPTNDTTATARRVISVTGSQI